MGQEELLKYDLVQNKSSLMTVVDLQTVEFMNYYTTNSTAKIMSAIQNKTPNPPQRLLHIIIEIQEHKR